MGVFLRYNKERQGFTDYFCITCDKLILLIGKKADDYIDDNSRAANKVVGQITVWWTGAGEIIEKDVYGWIEMFPDAIERYILLWKNALTGSDKNKKAGDI